MLVDLRAFVSIAQLHVAVCLSMHVPMHAYVYARRPVRDRDDNLRQPDALLRGSFAPRVRRQGPGCVVRRENLRLKLHW